MDKLLREILKRKQEIRSILNGQEDCDVDALEKELDSLEKRQLAIEKRKDLADKIGSGEIVATEIENLEERKVVEYGVDSKEYRSAFFKKIAGVELNEAEQRAMTTNASSAGVAVPTATMNKIYEKVRNESVVYALVTESHLRGNVSIPFEGVTNDVERKGEGENGTVQNDTLDELKLGAKKYIKLVRLTFELENTAIDALEDYIVSSLSRKLIDAIDEDIIKGDGLKGAKGILKTVTPTETTGESWTYDDICDLIGDIKAKARKNATLMMSTNTLYKQIKKIKDEDKKPIFNPDLNKVLGRDVVECDDVPDGTILFGDFSGYMFNWNKDAVIDKSKEAGFESGDSVFRIIALADGGLLNLGAFTAKAVKASA